MRITAQQTSEKTLTDLARAMDTRRPVTITYVKADGTTSVRTIELYDLKTTSKGHVIARAADRQSGEMRTWRLDRIVSYTLHRGRYTVVLPEATAAAPQPTTPAALVAFEIARDERPGHRLATTIAPHATHMTTTARLNNLAAAFAA